VERLLGSPLTPKQIAANQLIQGADLKPGADLDVRGNVLRRGAVQIESGLGSVQNEGAEILRQIAVQFKSSQRPKNV
jgi:hypothetical protein